MTTWRRLLGRIAAAEPPSYAATGTAVDRSADPDAEPTPFRVLHAAPDRWRLEAPPGTLVLVADRRGTVVVEDGAARHHGPDDGWLDLPAGLLIRPAACQLGADVLARFDLVEPPVPGEVAGRPCSRVVLRWPQPGTAPLWLWVDDATGILLRVAGGSVPTARSATLHAGYDTLTPTDDVPDEAFAVPAAAGAQPAREHPDHPAPAVAPGLASLGGRLAAAVLLAHDPAVGAWTVRARFRRGDGSVTDLTVDRRPYGRAPYDPRLGVVYGVDDDRWAWSIDSADPLSPDDLDALARALLAAG